MIPKTMERMRNQLSHWGYPLYLVERLRPWGLIHCYNSERRKRTTSHSSEITLDITVIETQIVDPIRLKRNPKKYRGTILKNRELVTSGR
jgi:hypothetical protein